MFKFLYMMFPISWPLFVILGQLDLMVFQDHLFSNYLMYLYDLSFPSNTFYRLCLKLGLITPIFKSGNPSNYHNITKLPHLSKIFEILVLNCIRPFLNNVLFDEQHGVQPGRSSTTFNLVFSAYIYVFFHMHNQVNVINNDLSKAFDRVDHSLLINSLVLFDIDNPLLSWLRSYLINCIQFVSIYPSKFKITKDLITLHLILSSEF